MEQKEAGGALQTEERSADQPCAGPSQRRRRRRRRAASGRPGRRRLRRRRPRAHRRRQRGCRRPPTQQVPPSPFWLRPLNLYGWRAPGMRAPRNTTQFLMQQYYQDMRKASTPESREEQRRLRQTLLQARRGTARLLQPGRTRASTAPRPRGFRGSGSEGESSGEETSDACAATSETD